MPRRTDAQVEIMIYFSDRDLVGPYQISVPPRGAPSISDFTI